MRCEKWVPKAGDRVFHVCEFALGDSTYQKLPPGFDRHGYEIVESVVTGEYGWKKGGTGCRSVSKQRLLGDNANNCFYWRAADYGKRFFQTFEDAIPLADEMAEKAEAWLRMCKAERKVFRHWRDGEREWGTGFGMLKDK